MTGRRQWRPMWALVLVLALCCHWVQAPGTCHQLSVTDGFAGELTISGGLFDPTSATTAQECAAFCGQLGTTHSAVETMDIEDGTLACLCAPEEEFQQVTTSSSECTGCSDSSCGGVDGIVWITPAAKDLADLTLSVSPTGPVSAGSTVTVTAETDVPDVVFSIMAGDQSPALHVVGTNSEAGTAASLSQELVYYAPGTFTIVVSAKKETGASTLTRQSAVNITWPAKLFEVNCPPVVEPNDEYHCGAVISGSDVQVDTMYGENGEATTFQVPNVPLSLRGAAPPQGGVAQGTLMYNSVETFLITPPYVSATRLTGVRAYGSSAGQCLGQLVTPSCASSEVFCAASSACSSSCATQPESDGNSQCSASIFCPLSGMCAAGAVSAGDCGTTSVPSGFTAGGDTFPISVEQFQHTSQEITTPLTAQPGQMVQVTCTAGAQVAAMSTASGGDLDAAGAVLTAADGRQLRHLVQVTGEPLQQVSWPHTCTTPVQMVPFTATLPTNQAMTNSTSCEYIIRNVSITLAQDDRDLPLEPSGAVYLDSSKPATVKLNIKEGAPVVMNWNYGTDALPDGTQDLQDRVDPEQFYSQTVTYPDSGTFIINASATNTHSDQLGATWTTQEVILQNPVLEAWTVEIITAQILTVPTAEQQAEVEFLVKLPETERLPTDAFIYAHFGDSYSMTDFEPLSDHGITVGETQPVDGFYQFKLTHDYKDAGLYSVTINMKNEISNITLEVEVDVEEKIVDFVVEMNFYVNNVLQGGLGDDLNEYHNDKNITFVMSMTQGSVTRYEMYNTSSGEEVLLETFQVADKLKPTPGGFLYFFPENQLLNLTFKAFNTYEESVSVEATIWITDPVTPIKKIQIVEGPDVTSRGQDKPITIVYECASTAFLCLVIDYGDNAPPAAYGDESICMANYSTAKFQPNELTMPMEVAHTYWRDGRYNLTALLFNPVSRSTAELSFLVVPFSCPKPIMNATGASPIRESANEYFKAAGITVETETTIPNCDVEFTTMRRWAVTLIDELTGESLEQVEIENVLPSWNKSNLFLKKNFLDFGLYRLDYTLTLYEGDEMPEMPYSVMLTTYVDIIRSPLVAIMVEGSVSRLVRGWGQGASLAPGNHSIDPDLPDDKNFECEWYCRLLTEEFPRNDTELLDKPLHRVRRTGDPRPTQNNGGCFGDGPGRLDYHSCVWDIDTSILHPSGEEVTFQLIVIVKKDGRKAETFIDLEMVSGSPPMVSILCASKKLCSATDGGVFVNPENRLGLRGSCENDCYPPLTFQWKVSSVDKETGETTPIDDVENYIMSEPGTEYLSLQSTFFSNYSRFEKFHVSLKSNNSHVSKKTGAATFYVIINKPPNVKDALCNIRWEGGHRALLDIIYIDCQLPKDPDGHEIGGYAFMTKTTNTDTVDSPVWKTVAKASKPTMSLRFPYGNVTVYYKVTDKLGSASLKKVINFNSVMPSKQEFDGFMSGPVFSTAIKLKKSKEVAVIMQAVETIRKYAPWNAPGYEEPGVDKADAAAAVSEQNANALTSIDDMPSDGPAALGMKASTLDSVMSSSVGSPEKSLQIDSATTSASVDLAGGLIEGAEEAEPATPDEMKDVFASVNTVVAATSAAASVIARDTDCKAVPEADRKKSALTPFDTRITDPTKRTDNTDIQKQHSCNVRERSMEAGAENTKKFDGMGTKMKFLTIRTMVPGESTVTKSAGGMAMKIAVMMNMTAATLNAGDSGSAVQTGQNFCPTGNCNDSVATAVTEYSSNVKSSAVGADDLSSDAALLSMEVKSTNGADEIPVKNLTEPLIVTLNRPAKTMSSDANCSDCLPGPTLTDPTVALQNKTVPLIYSQFRIEKPHSAFNTEIYLTNAVSHRMFVMISIGRQPTLKKHDLFKMVDDFPVVTDPPREINATKKFDWFVSSDIVNNRTGRAFVAVGELKSELDLEATKQKLDTNETVEGALAKHFLTSDFSTTYLIRTFTSSCYYYDDVDDKWTSDGLKCVGANDRTVLCESSHLTMFGSGFVVEPNTIDFAYVFANASFTDNLTIYMTMIVSLGLYFILVIWARWQDKKDVEKVGARPMPDNDEANKYLYEVIVYTGHAKNAATDSVVSLVVAGEKDETPVRTFGKPKRKFFRKGGQDAFVMACPRPLGDLLHLRVWHDNSGAGRYSSWYLQYIHIRDVQTGKHYDFVGNRWLAVEEDDGKIDALISVAGKEQLGQFSHVFSHTSQQNLSDGHLWFSVFLRPPRSRFTRVQRVSSCFALLFLSMMVNAMWYGVVPSTPSTGAINFGPMSLSMEQISVGVMSNLIVFPPSFLIVFLFKKARMRKLRKSRIDEALEKQKFGNQVAKSERPVSAASKSEKNDVDGKKKKKKKPLTLPWWCRIIAWVLCVICLFGSAFIVWAYGVQFGNEKTTKWLTSLLMSFFSSILIIQPIKVFLIAMIISSIFKSIDLDGDDADEDEQCPTLASDEEWIFAKSKKKARYSVAPDIYDQKTLEKMRVSRLNEVQMWRIIKEIVSYGFFLYILIILSFDNRDPNSFFLRANLEAAFIKEGDLTGNKPDFDFSKVHDAGTFWTWAQNVVMQELRAQNWYDHVSPPYGLKGFLDDRVNRIMGYGMIRQIRSKPNTCRIHSMFADRFNNCAALTGLFHEEDGNFCTNWTRSGSRKDCNRGEYRYKSAKDLDGLPYIGSLDVYGGGGYVYKLTGRMGSIAKEMQRLREEAWIDHMTRAVLVEFAVYNSQVNLFGIATIYAEAVPGGGLLPGWRFDGVRLIRHHNGFQLFVFVCEIVYMLFIIYFMVREIRDVVKQKKDYFKSYWVYAEISIILLSWAAFIVYIMRYIETDTILETFKRTYGNGYVKMQYAQTLDDVFGYILGMLVFISTIKFSKLLRFNRRIGMLSATLKQCWGDLTGFFLIFFIALGTFAMVFHLLLVTHMDDFKNMMSATESAFAMLLNKFDFESMRQGSLLAVVLFLIFAITMSIFFVNVLLTIIIRAFQQIKDDVFRQPNDFEILEFIQLRMMRFMGVGQRRVQPLHEHVRGFQEDQRHRNNQQNSVDQLPSKMDQFLNQVNDLYFDGQLRLNNKQFLKKTLSSHQDR